MSINFGISFSNGLSFSIKTIDETITATEQEITKRAQIEADKCTKLAEIYARVNELNARKEVLLALAKNSTLEQRYLIDCQLNMKQQVLTSCQKALDEGIKSGNTEVILAALKSMQDTLNSSLTVREIPANTINFAAFFPLNSPNRFIGGGN